jgi:hypothetical protein
VDIAMPGRGALVAALACLLCFGVQLAGADSTQQGSVTIEVSNEVIVPGQRLDVRYRASRGTLQGRVDVYFSMLPPDGPLVFLKRGQRPSTDPVALRTNVKVRGRTKKLLRSYPVRRTFGTYTYSVVLLYAGKAFGDEDALASEPASASFTFDPLSEHQRALVAERGNPDLLTMTWTAALKQKNEQWLYYSGDPTNYDFTNGELVRERALEGDAGGDPPALDPAVFHPQTTLEELEILFGAPDGDIEIGDGDPEYRGVTFPAGLEVVFRDGRLTYARTFAP